MLSDLDEGRRNIFRKDQGGIPALRHIFLCRKHSKLELANFLNWIYTSKTTSAKLISSD